MPEAPWIKRCEHNKIEFAKSTAKATTQKYFTMNLKKEDEDVDDFSVRGRLRREDYFKKELPSSLVSDSDE